MPRAVRNRRNDPLTRASKLGGIPVIEAAAPDLDPGWVDDVLLAGPPDHECLVLDAPITRAMLRRLVAERRAVLASAGLGPSGSVALCLAPSLAFVTNLLATW